MQFLERGHLPQEHKNKEARNKSKKSMQGRFREYYKIYFKTLKVTQIKRET